MPHKTTPKSLLNFKAVLFDMDGTLFNSEPLHFDALLEVVELPSDFDWHPFLGMPDNLVLKTLFPEAAPQEIIQLILRKNEKLIEMINNKTLSEFQAMLTPGVYEFLTYLKTKSIPMALVTASEGVITEALLTKLELKHFFHGIYPREATARTKPSASPYLKAMRDLNVSSLECLIFEDSPTGLQAALEASAFVMKVTAHQIPDSKSSFTDLQSTDQFFWLISP